MMCLATPVNAAENWFTQNLNKLLMPGELIQGHAKYETDCDKCHVDFDDGSQTRLCLDCHEDVASDISLSEGFHGNLDKAAQDNCRVCHTDHKGRDADIALLDKNHFNHESTDYLLEGAHQTVQCASCHAADKKYRDASQDCIDCHQQDDRHQGGMGESCNDCHTVDSWKQAEFDHDDTDFKLEGAHVTTSCALCHADEKYQDTPQQCVACHLLSDIHLGSNGAECDQCHHQETWEESFFDHSEDAGYELLGRHQDLSCDACHSGDRSEESPGKTCISCHKADDVHLRNNGIQCQTCHDNDSWMNIQFDHNKDTDYKLDGGHQSVPCDSCHRNDRVDGPPGKQCIDCHSADDYHDNSLGRGCASCHNTSSWNDNIRFNHNLTVFPLVGGHALASCDACHANKDYGQTKSNCKSCHEAADVHEGLWGDRCDSCHNPNDWRLWVFDHNDRTDFVLDGQHLNSACEQCHQSVEALPASDCYSCHRNDDEHRLRFGRDCGRCHITESFSEIRMDR